MTAEESTIESRKLASVVGIGASAGGLQSLETLFTRLSVNTDLAFVVIMHLSPDVKSLMDEILARQTTMRVLAVEDAMPVEPNTVYVNLPSQHTEIRDGRFYVSAMDRDQIPRPIDFLFNSLAQSYGSRAVGVILSGTGSDGTEGVRSVRQADGTTIVESPDSAQFNGMPLNAISTGAVDFVLPREKIVDLLVQYAADPEADIKPESTPIKDAETGASRIFELLGERHGIDFADYKPGTVSRRIERRMQVNGLGSLVEYANFVSNNPGELDSLYFDLLIGVTKFFRDSEAFYALGEHLNSLVRRLESGQELRIWVAGCATGEEAYSIGILGIEAFARCNRDVRMKILATDLHEGALEIASKGIYPREAMEFVLPERQLRYFTPEDENRFRVSGELRRHIIFSRHNVIQDPPFTRLHLVACRNLLIYLKPNPQYRALSSFHFSLETQGLLMLGSSEVPGRLDDEFETIDGTWRIFRKRRSLPRLMNPGAEATKSMTTVPRRLINILSNDRANKLSFTGLLDAYDLLLKRFVDRALLLDEHRSVLHIFGDAHRYLSNASGRFSGSISRLLPVGLKEAIGAALIRSAKEPETRFLLKDVEYQLSYEETTSVDVAVTSLTNQQGHHRLWLIEFLDTDPEVRPIDTEQVQINTGGDNYESVVSELAYTKETLNATIEELETSNEELQSTNQELIASNEELQSTNEELQSVNEELYSVNAENQRQITRLQTVTDDLDNLLSFTDIGTIFLDHDLCIRRFTPVVTKFFNLVPHDIGRPLENFTHKLPIDNLSELACAVFESGEPHVAKLSVKEEHQIVLKIRKYRSGQDQRGVIINVIDSSLLGL